MKTDSQKMTDATRRALVDRAMRICSENRGLGAYDVDTELSRVVDERVYLIDSSDNSIIYAYDIVTGTHGRPKLVEIDDMGSVIHPDDLDDDDDVDGIAS